MAGAWLKELFGLPASTSFASTTGCQMAHVTALAAARHAVLERVGWDVGRDGLAGRPDRGDRGQARHATLDRALRLLGIGEAQIHGVPATTRAGSRSATSPRRWSARGAGDRLRAGRRGQHRAVDPLAEVAALVAGSGAWLHVDGAFGMWAAASPTRRHLVKGLELADSWATDAHKWLNVPYDSGLAFCADPQAHRGAMTAGAAYFSDAGAGSETRSTGRRSRRAARAGSRSTRPSARSGAAVSPS